MIGHTDGSVLNDDLECRGRGSRTPAVLDPVWNNPTRSRDRASSSDVNSDTGPENPDRDRKDTTLRSADEESVLSHG